MAKQINLLDYANKKEARRNTARKGLSVATFLGPYAICFAMFFVFPLLFGIVIAFSGFDGRTMFPTSFVGFENFRVIFTNKVVARDFWNSVWTTIKFCLCIVPLSILIPLGLALLVNTKCIGYKVFRALIYIPSIFPLTATGLILLRMFGYQYGWVNNFFNISVDWFGNVYATWFMVGFFCLWCGIGGNFIILCAGLENVDKTLYEAADIDGCNKWKKFLFVTLPGIKSQLFLVLFTTFIGYMNLYGQLFILASDNSDPSLRSAVYRIQNILTGSSRGYGFAAAMGIMLGLITIVFSIIQLQIDKERKAGTKRKDEFDAWQKNN
ncbi:MAG TPA: sugar ABC transporter permease [Candidatus Paceibacterota bacterium]|nr:sugar ABC transporter permease [Candidatus Paceibacterota bacterium]